jgi:hypothetical protein
MSPLENALEYISRGWAPVPIPHKSKRPIGDEWQKLRITETDARQWFNGEEQNIGVRLGGLSDGLADVDLDTTEAGRAAPYFLPRTLCFGRPSKPRSHWLFQSDLWQTEDKAALQFKFATGKGKDRKEQMILELRIGGGDKGAQTVFPGSVHETGELITWDRKENIALAEGETLKQCCARAASAALLACHFPSKGARHDAGLTLGGFLSRCGFSRPDTELFAEAVTIASGQPMEKVKDVRKAARKAWDEAGRPSGNARGFPILAETFGDDVAKHVAKWLGYEGANDPMAENAARPWERPHEAHGGEPFFNGQMEDGKAKLRPSVVEGSISFTRSYAPLSYPLEGILPSGTLYGLTARQGTGKTAFMQAAALAVATGRKEIIGVDVEPGRVAYVTIENPTDFKMKLAVGFYVHNISEEIDRQLAIVQGRDTPEQIVEGLALDAEENGPFTLVCFDTFQAGFSAANAGAFNDNEAVLSYVNRLRPLTGLPGFPAALVALHPTKNATEDELLPYGGGATMNEIDGNLTLWKGGQIKLHHNRVRGPEFEPRYFRIEKLSCPGIVDNKGRQILLPVMRPSTEMDAEERTIQEGNSQLALLKAMIDEPNGSQRDWGAIIGKPKGTVNYFLQRLKKEKLAVERFGKWQATKAGVTALS